MLQLRGVSFKWRDASCFEDGRHIGMIAQQVEAAFPEWVKEDQDGYKALSYEGFEALTVEAIRELHDEFGGRIEKLEAENDDLRMENDTQQKQLNALRSELDAIKALLMQDRAKHTMH